MCWWDVKPYSINQSLSVRYFASLRLSEPTNYVKPAEARPSMSATKMQL